MENNLIPEPGYESRYHLDIGQNFEGTIFPYLVEAGEFNPEADCSEFIELLNNNLENWAENKVEILYGLTHNEKQIRINRGISHFLASRMGIKTRRKINGKQTRTNRIS